MTAYRYKKRRALCPWGKADVLQRFTRVCSDGDRTIYSYSQQTSKIGSTRLHIVAIDSRDNVFYVQPPKRNA